MKSKDEAAKGILKLLADMKWPTLIPHEPGNHGGLEISGPARCSLVGRVANKLSVRNNEIYIGAYSPLADAIRDWQAADGEEEA